MKICKQCNKTWQNEFNICPICGGELMSEQQTKESVSMGDGNAINGGIHISKDYSQKYDNSLSSSNNTTNSNNSTVNNTTTQNFYGTMPFMQTKTVKSHEEILRERKIKYRECCKQVLADGLLNAEERNWLEEQRVLIDISAEVASSILNEVQISSRRSVMSMGAVHRIQLNNFKRAVEGNMVANIKRSMPQIKVVAEKFQEEEVQYLYYMVMAALNPNECVESYQNRRDDKYWLTFWVYVAFHKLGDVQNAESAMIELAKWQGLMPDENTVVLAALGSLMDGDKDMASDMCMQVDKNEYTPLLDPIMEVLLSIMNFDPDDSEIANTLIRYKFYVDNFLKEIYQSEIESIRLAQEEERRKIEEERIRRETELRRQQEEAELKRKEEAERRRKEEEERRAAELAERKRKEEEERLRREEESRRRLEEERKRLEQERQRLAEERRRKEEEERRRKEEEERRRKEEEERKRKAEEERKRKAEEEERKRREYEENDRYEGESRKCYCPKCGKGVNANTTFCSSCGHKLEKETKHVNVETKNSAKNYGSINGHEYVDLGLSVKWATCNMGSNKPEEYGDYYAWGEVNTKNDYTVENYDFSHEKKEKKGLWSFGFGSKKVKAYDYDKLGGNISGTKYDAARTNWGGSWRLPTKSELEELVNKCTWEWTTQNGVKGYKVTGPNGNSIFLPAAGYRDGSSLNCAGEISGYWSSTPDESDSYYACILCFDIIEHGVDGGDRGSGQSVRPVSE